MALTDLTGIMLADEMFRVALISLGDIRRRRPLCLEVVPDVLNATEVVLEEEVAVVMLVDR